MSSKAIRNTCVVVLGIGAAAAAAVKNPVELYSVQGAEIGSLGHSLAVLGDIDGDGVEDFLTGMPWAASQAGRVEIRSGANGALLAAQVGKAAGDKLGQFVGALGDINGDGVADYAASATEPIASTKPGYVRVYSGKDHALLFELSSGVTQDNFGSAIGAVADLDGDGVGEIAVGANQVLAGGQGRGYVAFYSGADGGEVFRVQGFAPADWFGWAIDGIDDFDGDGVDDLLVGAPQLFGTGYIVVLSAKKAHDYAMPLAGNKFALDDPAVMTNAIAPFFAVGTALDSRFGYSVSSAGDVDGDGVQDFLVGAPHSSASGTQSGEAIVVSGNTSQIIYDFKGFGEKDFQGISVAGGRDLNGDGIPDFVIGAYEAAQHIALPTTFLGNGYVRVHSGKSGNLLGTAHGPIGNSGMGRSVALTGDINGDGRDDFLAGAPGTEGMKGRVFAYGIVRLNP